MKIIVRYCLPWGNFSTQAVYVDSDLDVGDLKRQIEKKFDIKVKKQVLKYKRDGTVVRSILFQLTIYSQ